MGIERGVSWRSLKNTIRRGVGRLGPSNVPPCYKEHNSMMLRLEPKVYSLFEVCTPNLFLKTSTLRLSKPRFPSRIVHRLTSLSVLPSLQQPLRHLVLFDDIDMCAPARQRVPVDRIQQRLRDGLEEVLRSLYSPYQHSSTSHPVKLPPFSPLQGQTQKKHSQDPAPTAPHKSQKADHSPSRSL